MTGSQVIYNPAVSNPFGIVNANAQGANYATESGYSAETLILLGKEVQREIFDAAPQQFNALKVLFSKNFETVGSDEHEYLEHSFGRSSLTANAISAAVGATPGSPASQNITLTAASISRVGLNYIITYPDNTQAIVRSINTGTNVITVESITSGALPAVADDDIFAIRSTIDGDGFSGFTTYERLETVTRYNYVQFFMRVARWGEIEQQKFINMGTTNYMDADKKEKVRQLRTDLFVSFFNGVRGEFQLSGGTPAKSMGGIYPLMIAAGATPSNPTISGLKSAFEAAAFATNYKAEGGVRFVFGTDEMLYELSKAFKEPGIYYTPDNKIADLNLDLYKIGTMRFVPVPCELFKEASCFPAAWSRRLLCVDMESVQPVIMKGFPPVEMGSTLGMQIRERFKDWWVRAQLSLRYNNPLSGFIIDVQS